MSSYESLFWVIMVLSLSVLLSFSSAELKVVSQSILKLENKFSNKVSGIHGLVNFAGIVRTRTHRPLKKYLRALAEFENIQVERNTNYSIFQLGKTTNGELGQFFYWTSNYCRSKVCSIWIRLQKFSAEVLGKATWKCETWIQKKSFSYLSLSSF